MKQRLLLFIGLLPLCLLAQRPMTKAQILPKMDSIVKEAKLLFLYMQVKKDAAERLSKAQLLASDTNCIIYPIADSLKFVAFSRANGLCYEVVYLLGEAQKPSYQGLKRRKLSSAEEVLVKGKTRLIKAANDQALTPLGEQGYFRTAFIAQDKRFSYYLLECSKKDSILPLGNNYIFESSSSGGPVSRRNYSHSAKELELNSETEKLLLVYNDKKPFITAIDICKFLLHQHYGRIDKIEAFSRRNRRNFIYNATKHQIRLEP